MKINKGDKFVATEKCWFVNEGVVVNVINVDENNIVSFMLGDGSKGYMDSITFEQHFKKLESKNNIQSISDRVEEIMENADFTIDTAFNKCTVVTCKLPNGFVIVESCGCVNPENYNEEVGTDICFSKIEEKIWELEEYLRQEELYRKCNEDTEDCPYGCEDCPDNCPCDGDFCLFDDEGMDKKEDDNDFIEHDCDECMDYDCEFNPHNSTVNHPVS